MKLEVFNKENKKIEELEVPDKIFKVKWQPELVHQALVTFLANLRKPIAHTKDRSEVSGGGRKPWRQKGTGRARHGSIRSPLWIGGGVVFGPRKDKIFSKKINKKMKKIALLSVLSKKIENNDFKVIDNLKIEKIKTKEVVEILKNFFTQKPSILFVLEKNNKNFVLAARNLEKVFLTKVDSLNIYDLLTHKKVFFEKGAINELISKYKN